ncbi:hypothetical protein AVEN_247723-1 [Araneus ventricosus]|uniref:Cilia- and flagella-associated protein 97 n=1 Tax=Araneus ventricosus TaxID=182803 RepID=A0A4Y2PGM9_ARAVE|nr:hypothetical protein AVEN_247723-1 [Araneus ventricosus]
MSLRVGLGASQDDLDVQGEIDFDFFEASDSTNAVSEKASPEISKTLKSEHPASCIAPDNSENNSSFKKELGHGKSDQHSLNISEASTSYNYNKPLITVSCDDVTGVVQKTTIEAVIPTPFSYKDNKCGKVNPLDLKKIKKASSPYFKSKIFKDEIDISDDSSISSMSSGSVSSLSEDSFELNETDSMTDVSSLASPYACQSPTNNDPSTKQKNLSCSDKSNRVKKDGVKFIDDLDKQPCAKCSTIDFHELVNAMNRLQMKQNMNMCARSKSPVITHNAKCRKNFSFSNEEVRRIDIDNQVLLKKIVAQQNRPKSNSLPTSQIRSSSAVNRHRQQRHIELENLVNLFYFLIFVSYVYSI